TSSSSRRTPMGFPGSRVRSLARATGCQSSTRTGSSSMSCGPMLVRGRVGGMHTSRRAGLDSERPSTAGGTGATLRHVAAESIPSAAGSLQVTDPDVPVREGDYGDRVMAVEPGGVEFIALSERHGTPRQLFWTWNSPNWEFATMFLGVIPITVFGGGFWPTVLAVFVGSALGAAAVGVLSTWGPRFGVPQLVQSRGAFG